MISCARVYLMSLRVINSFYFFNSLIQNIVSQNVSFNERFSFLMQIPCQQVAQSSKCPFYNITVWICSTPRLCTMKISPIKRLHDQNQNFTCNVQSIIIIHALHYHAALSRYVTAWFPYALFEEEYELTIYCLALQDIPACTSAFYYCVWDVTQTYCNTKM